MSYEAISGECYALSPGNQDAKGFYLRNTQNMFFKISVGVFEKSSK